MARAAGAARGPDRIVQVHHGILPDACCCCERHASPIAGAPPARRHLAMTRSGSLPTRVQLPKRKSVCARLVGGKTKEHMTDVMRSSPLRRLVVANATRADSGRFYA